jgi:hypothetical protein
LQDQQPVAAIPKADKKARPAQTAAEERVLRAKYLDWCSAQVADHFVALSPTEIFELAERAARDTTVSSRLSSSLDAAALERARVQDLGSYRTLVEQVTEVLWQQLQLPSFEEWQELYQRNPEAIEEKLLGFWREQL